MHRHTPTRGCDDRIGGCPSGSWFPLSALHRVGTREYVPEVPRLLPHGCDSTNGSSQSFQELGRPWLQLTDISLSEISNISVVSLPTPRIPYQKAATNLPDIILLSSTCTGKSGLLHNSGVPPTTRRTRSFLDGGLELDIHDTSGLAEFHHLRA